MRRIVQCAATSIEISRFMGMGHAARVVRFGQPPCPRLIRNVCYRAMANIISTADMMKGFGCREAYESLPCRNPRGTVEVYGDFDFRLMSAMA